MPISETMAGSVAEFLLLNPDTTVDQAYQELTQPRGPGIHLLTWIAIPAFAGLMITRWPELEQIATLAGQDLGPLQIADLPRLRYPAAPDGAADAGYRRSWDLALAVLQPAPVLDERLHTTQQARELRDSHPGRRAGVLAQGRLTRLLIVESLGPTTASKGFERPRHGVRTPRESAAPAAFALEPPDPAAAAIWQPRRLEAATPKYVQLGRLSELWVKISLASSPGLRAELPTQTVAGDLIDASGLRQTETEIRYERGVEEINVVIEVIAPDFKIYPPQFGLLVRRSRDSATLKFQLEPTRERQASPISLTIYQNAQTRATIAALTLYMDVLADERAQATPSPNVWQYGQRSLFPAIQPPMGLGDRAMQIFFIGGPFVAGDMTSVDTISGSTAVAIGPEAQARYRGGPSS